MRRASKVDANHAEIVSALRSAGATVQSLAAVGAGCPDLVVGYRGKNYLMEVKDGAKNPGQRLLTRAEIEWHLAWAGQVRVVESVEEALAVLEKK